MAQGTPAERALIDHAFRHASTHGINSMIGVLTRMLAWAATDIRGGGFSCCDENLSAVVSVTLIPKPFIEQKTGARHNPLDEAMAILKECEAMLPAGSTPLLERIKSELERRIQNQKEQLNAKTH